MELTANQKLVHQMYIAYYQRPADPEGLKYWVDQLETYQDWTVISAAFGAPENAENQALYGSKSREEVIAEIYQSAFDRAAVAEEISFWANSEFSLTNLAFAIINGAQNDDLATVNAKVAFSHELVAQVDPVGNGDPADYEVPFTALDGIDLLKDVNKDTDVTPEYVEQAVASQINPNSVFTLTENIVTTVTPAVEGEVLTKMVTYWGFNPHGHGETDVDNLDGNNPDGNDNNLTNEGPADGGVPVSALLSYISELANTEHLQALLAKFEDVGVDLGAIAIDQDTPDFSSVTSLTLGGDGDSNANAMTIGFENDAGEFASAVVELSDDMFDLISSLIFDEEGNSRLFEVEVPVTSYWLAEADDGVDLPTITVQIDGDDVEVYADSDGEAIEIPFVYGAKDAVENESIVPIVLTPTENNGGTEEHGKTSDANDLIVAARLDLLHGAYIDAGGGENTLEIDAKGYYAQPKALIGIQTISIQNLPNVYTDASGNSDYPDLQANASSLYNDSIIDISRATDLENLSVSASDFDSLNSTTVTSAGDLTVAGIRNGATVTLDGNFDNDTVTLNFRETAAEGVNLVLHNVNFDEGSLELANNAPTLNIESAGAGNVIETANLSTNGANLMTLNITGDAKLYINSSLADAFAEGTPAVIDASGNTGGVDLNIDGHDDEVVFIGTAEADDHFHAHLDTQNSGQGRNVTITGGNGDGEYDVSTNGDIMITVGEGNNEIEAESDRDDSWAGDELEGTVTVVAGNGQNDITVDSADAFSITAGNGDNRIDAVAAAETGVTDSDVSTIVLGDGQNEVDATAGQLSIVAGNGNNEIEVNDASSVSGSGTVAIEAGDGDNTIEVNDFEVVTVTTGAGNDALTVTGGNINYADGGTTEEDNENSNETLLTIDLGAGANTLQLGNDASGGVTAVDGSTITGENITLVVQDDSDISRADVTGVTAVQMGSGDVLTLSLTQFIEMGGSASFSTIGESFAANSVLNIVVDQSTSLDDLNIEALPRSIDLSFEVMDGVTLEMTAQQLHERVTDGGVVAYDDGGNVDLEQGTVFITGAGEDFDPYDTGLTGSIDENAADLHLRLDARPGGYERPAEATSYTRLQINTDDLVNGEQTPFDTHHTFLRIIGEGDFNFTPVEGGLDEWGQPIPNAGDSIQLGSGTENFKVDFSAVSGTVTGLTLDNFENVDAIYGNGGARVDVKLEGNVATDAAGLVSKGVSTYVVTAVDTDAGTVDIDGSPVSTDADEVYFFTCETTKDLEVLGLQGNYGATVHFDNTERGVEFLMEVEYAKTDGYAVGTLFGEFARPGAAAVVNVVGLDALPAGETQKVAGIVLENAATAIINVEGGNTEIEALNTGAVTELTVNADANLTLPELDADLEMFDASGVTGALSVSIDIDGNSDNALVFTGAAGSTTLELGDVDAGDIASIDGVGPIQIVMVDSGWNDTADLTATTLGNIAGVTLGEDQTAVLTLDQAYAIGAGNITGEGSLTLTGLNDQPFSLADFAVDVTNMTLRVVEQETVTLNPATDLTGITTLEVYEGTTLNLTAAQFQQLNGSNGGIITVLDGSDEGTTVDLSTVTINITDLSQADLENGVLDTSAITAANINITTAESVTLVDATNLTGVDTITLADGTTLSVEALEALDGIDVAGIDAIIKILDETIGATTSIDASGFDVSQIYLANTLLQNGVNVDALLAGLPFTVEKVIYNGEGLVIEGDQTVTVEAQTTVVGDLEFNKLALDTEVQNFTLNLEGGVELQDVDLSSAIKTDADGNPLLNTHLETVVINSNKSVDADNQDLANLMSGETANVIGTLTAAGTLASQGSTNDTDSNGYEDDSEENNLLDVTIAAEQDLLMDGIVFSAVNGDDAWTINDQDAATATVEITGTADVTLGLLDTSDDDVDALEVNNAGTGTVAATINGNNIDDDAGNDNVDALSFTGSNIELTVLNMVDLSDDDLSGVSQITIGEGATLTLSQAQLDAVGVANLINGDTDNVEDEVLNIVELGADVFDVTALDDGISVGYVQTQEGNITLNPATNLTGVGEIRVPEGSTLNLTAAQFQQLNGAGTIVSVDTDGLNGAEAITVNITDLTQDDIWVDANDNDEQDAGEGFDLSNVNVAGGTLTVSQADATVTLGSFDNEGLTGQTLDTDVSSVLNGATYILGDNQTLELVNSTQADGLIVNGGTGSVVTFRFDTLDVAQIGANGVPSIDVSEYNVAELHTINTMYTNTTAIDGNTTVDGEQNVEVILSNLESSVELIIYDDPLALGVVSARNRVVTIQEGVTVGGELVFNDIQQTVELTTLTLNLEGDAGINGDLRIPTVDEGAALQANNFGTLTINSNGSAANSITGNITAVADATGVPSTATEQENSLLNVAFNLEQDMVLGVYDEDGHVSGGDIIFTALGDTAQAANLTLEGTADLTLHGVDTSDNDTTESIGTLNIVNNAGTLTMTGGTEAIAADNTETINISGTGDVVIGSNDLQTTGTPDASEAVSSTTLSTLDASGLEGDLTLTELAAVDSTDFSFTSGTGVTTLTIDGADLNADSDGADDIQGNQDDEPGWSFDLSQAAADSELHIGANSDWTAGNLDIDLGANSTLYIDATTDWTALDSLTINQTNAIVLADGATLTLTAEQANGLTIVGANGAASTGQVNVVGLGDSLVDLSGISADIAGWVNLEDNDVTLDANTDLGAMAIALQANNAGDLAPSAGQIIRMTDEAQADGRLIHVFQDTADLGLLGAPGADETALNDAQEWDSTGDDDTNATNSSNVAWLFESITSTLDTSKYDGDIGRVWMPVELINSVGGDMESLFNTLPDSILRVDFNDTVDLSVLLNSNIVNRVIELTSFSEINGLIEVDDGVSPEEHIQTLTLELGGETSTGNIVIGDVVAAADTDPLTPEFETLTINSRVALHDDHFLATEDYVNDNDGTVDNGETAQPDAVNTIGDISVGGTNTGIDLIDVVINTFGTAATSGTQTPGDMDATVPVLGDDGAELVGGTIIFDTEGDDATTAGVDESVVNLTVTGENDVTFKGLDLTDGDITAFNLDVSGYAPGANLTFTGGSPAFEGGDSLESIKFIGGEDFEPPVNGDTIRFGYEWVDANGDGIKDDDEFVIHTDATDTPYAGIASGELSEINVSSVLHHSVHFGYLADIDSSDDDTTDDGTDNPDRDAFTLIGNGTDTTGIHTTAIIGAAMVNGTLTTPTLESESTWRFENARITLTDTAVLNPGATLEFNNAALIIEGDVDLSEVTLVLTGTSSIVVAEGQSLTLTVSQVNALTSPITGEGTVNVIDDPAPGTLDGDDLTTTGLDKLQTVGLNFAGVTVDDLTLDLELHSGGATMDDGSTAGFEVIGSAAADVISGSMHADTFNMGEGDDVITGGLGGDTFNVEDGTDTVTDLFADGSSQVDDVLVVSANAEAVATGIANFTATADTINNGIATLTAAANGIIDVALAGGDNGFNLNGTTGTAVLTGGANDDIINGGDGESVQDGIDILTGNGGADQFVFNMNIDSTVTLEVETTPGVDREWITIDAEGDGSDETNEELNVNYTIGTGDNAVNRNANIDLTGVDTTDQAAVLAKLADDLNAMSSISAVVDTDNNRVMVSADNGEALTINAFTVAAGAWDGVTAAPDADVGSFGDGSDTAQETTVTVNGTPTAGDVYDLLIQGIGGAGATYVAGSGIDPLTAEAVAAGLTADFEANDADGSGVTSDIEATVDGNVITFADSNGNDGGFTIAPPTITAAFGGSGASADTAAIDTADIITDFTSGTDSVVFDGLVDGSGSNYAELAQQADETAAFNAAQAAFDGTVQYFLTSILADNAYATATAGVEEGDTLGLLYFDANMDEEVDGVVVLLGVDATTFAATDIFGAVA